jgi:ribosomal protein S18 acetylase RimI-like enzyme
MASPRRRGATKISGGDAARSAGAPRRRGKPKASASTAPAAAAATPRRVPGPTKSAAKPGRASKPGGKPAARARAAAAAAASKRDLEAGGFIAVRRIHRRDINRVWEFLKVSFRDVNSETVEYQRPRSKHRFEEIYEEEGVQQLVFEVDGEIVAYTECSYEVTGSDNWINPRYFEKRDMRPLFIDELAVHPAWHGRGVGSFVLEQLHHLARVNGLNHLVLEVAENNENALAWYKKRAFKKLDAAIFMACAIDTEPELLPPRALTGGEAPDSGEPAPE